MHDNRDLMCEWVVVAEDHRVCQSCGYVYRRVPVGPLRRNCPAKAVRPELTPAWGLGDHVALALDAVGITEKRVTWFLRASRLIDAKEGCGCSDRKKQLNRVGARLLAWAKRKRVLINS